MTVDPVKTAVALRERELSYMRPDARAHQLVKEYGDDAPEWAKARVSFRAA